MFSYRGGVCGVAVPWASGGARGCFRGRSGTGDQRTRTRHGPCDFVFHERSRERPGCRENGQGVGRGSRDGDTAGSVEIGLTVFGRPLRLELQPIDIFAPGATVVHITDQGRFEEPARANTYRGVVLGASSSVVAVSIEAGNLEGLIVVDDDLYLIEPASRIDAAAAPDELIALHGSATQTGLAVSPGGRNRSNGPGMSALNRAVPLNLLQIAAVGDFEYFQLHGANASTQIASVVNQVDAIYKSEIETSIQILAT